MCERFEHVCELFPEVGKWWRIGKVRWVLNGSGGRSDTAVEYLINN